MQSCSDCRLSSKTSSPSKQDSYLIKIEEIRNLPHCFIIRHRCEHNQILFFRIFRITTLIVITFLRSRMGKHLCNQHKAVNPHETCHADRVFHACVCHESCHLRFNSLSKHLLNISKSCEAFFLLENIAYVKTSTNKFEDIYQEMIKATQLFG